MSQDQISHGHPMMRIDVSRERRKRAVGHADADRRHVFEGIRHRKQQDVHEDLFDVLRICMANLDRESEIVPEVSEGNCIRFHHGGTEGSLLALVHPSSAPQATLSGMTSRRPPARPSAASPSSGGSQPPKRRETIEVQLDWLEEEPDAKPKKRPPRVPNARIQPPQMPVARSGPLPRGARVSRPSTRRWRSICARSSSYLACPGRTSSSRPDRSASRSRARKRTPSRARRLPTLEVVAALRDGEFGRHHQGWTGRRTRVSKPGPWRSALPPWTG